MNLLICVTVFVLCVHQRLPFTDASQLKLSRKDEIRLDKEFREYHKPAVKVIKTVDGDTYNCVDFYKQPAFDHPALRNHTYHPQMKFPTRSLKNEKIEKNNLIESRNLFRKLWINGKGCPKGTVPIRKYTKDAFIHAKLFQESYSTSSAHPNDWNENIAVSYFHTSSIFSYWKLGENHNIHGCFRPRYNGGSVTFGVYNFPIKDNQYSFSQLTIARLPDFLRTGWTLNPMLYSDKNTRSFIFSQIGDKSCYNLLCASFVVLRPDIPVDGILQPPTDGPREMQFIIGRTSGAQWYVQLETAIVGFWPPDLFSGLAGLADAVEWGGAVLTVNGEPGPGMGAGWRPVSDSISDGYGRFVSVIDDQNNVVQAGALAVYRSDNVYEFHDLGFVRDNGHLIYYGGPGHQ